MEITEVRISLREEEKLKAFVTITFDGCFVVRGAKVIDGNQGLFVAMPSRRKSDGTFQDVAHPICAEMRRELEEQVLDEYYIEAERQDEPAREYADASRDAGG
ncbi:MAG: septation regulator SpoVG [Gemmatimonadota bacterium]|jgi:stage V sporulation protein G|nr:septation regulator SpoVG [Gemmatimonadota bacterium]MDP6802729.1 septation regulator SpoVG [Gemmatimonadota bacterium]MDP7031750.1 septation regulator SpoVG [Gemmatimonadota bacterium]